MAGRQKLPMLSNTSRPLLNHVEHDVADNTVFSYDNNHEDGDDDTDDEDHDRGDGMLCC